MSEKVDGWRMIWDGSRFITRQGTVFAAPDWFLAGMPAVPLDGELFAGRGGFNEIQGRIANGWRGLTFQIFDAPEADGGFAMRLHVLASLSLPSHAAIVPQAICGGVDVMRAEAARIVREGGEGVVVRNPAAVWKAGRSSNVLRLVPVDPAFNRRKTA